MSFDVLWQNSKQTPQVTVFDTDGTTVIPAGTFADAAYRVFEAGTCTAVLTKDLGSGISVVGDNFEIDIDIADIPFSGTNGEYTHQFRVGFVVSEYRPPIFDEEVPVIAACPA